MTQNKKASPPSRIVFKLLRFFAGVFYKKIEIVGIEDIPTDNTVIVANHCQLNGPIIAELFMPDNCYIWANGQMVRCREVPGYAMEDFFPYKSRCLRPVYKLASYALSVLLPCVINNARTIPVYRDARIVTTLRTSVRMLEGGRNILIFPECHNKNNNIVNEFQENFVDLARFYYKKTGKELTFLPMYIAPDLGKAVFGQGTRFDSTKDIAEERTRIASFLEKRITELGRALPHHTVIPFDNIPRRSYISNKDIDAIPGEAKY